MSDTRPVHSISVIMPTYNKGHFLDSMLASYQHQTHDRFELVIVDDGSTDNTREIVDRYRGSLNIRYLHQPNKGVPQAGEGGASETPQAAVSKEPKKERTPRVDWAQLLRRTFALEVFTCAWCGGRRRVLAYLTAPNAVRTIPQHLALPTRPALLAAAQGPPQQAWC
jgi:cellulose synthase/poly-beta-1,6-N-acetylglucosamine synthase-like glycosyltransferase